MGLKTCTQCRAMLPLSAFHKSSLSPDGHKPKCKTCRCSYQTARYHGDPAIRANHIKAAKDCAARRKKDPDWIAARRESIAQARKGLDDAGRERLRRNQRTAYRNSRDRPEVRIRSSVGNAVRDVIHSGKAKRHIFALLGYSREDLVQHLQRQFSTGMSWANYGDWHIDHITPLQSFDFGADPDGAVRAAWSLGNLRPLWAIENKRKHAQRTHLI